MPAKRTTDRGAPGSAGEILLSGFHSVEQEVAARFESLAGALTIRQFLVLQSLSAQEGVSQTALVEKTGVDRSTLSDVVRRLKDRGMISRRRRREDARANVLGLTAEGKTALAAAEAVVNQVVKEVFGCLTAAEAETMRTLLRKVLAAARERGTS